jgi:drug/metabolite transporter (DMT)-like permease
MPFIGEIAALTAAFFWGFGAFLFESAGARIGALATNLMRLLLACLLLSVTLFILQGSFFPLHASKHSVCWLGLSGLVGLALGDGALFYAIVILGPRLSILLLSLAPPFTAIIAWLFLDERLGLYAILGILLTFCAIIWVVSEPHGKEHFRGSKAVGVTLGLIGALGQGLGVILAKYGLTAELDALSATLLRMIPAAVVMWLFAVIIRQAKPTIVAMKDKRAALAVLGGAVFGPFIGVWLSIVAVKYTEAGVAATLLATVPIMIIPLEFIIHKRKPSMRALLGTMTAVVGIALIFMR